MPIKPLDFFLFNTYQIVSRGDFPFLVYLIFCCELMTMLNLWYHSDFPCIESFRLEMIAAFAVKLDGKMGAAHPPGLPDTDLAHPSTPQCPSCPEPFPPSGSPQQGFPAALRGATHTTGQCELLLCSAFPLPAPPSQSSTWAPACPPWGLGTLLQ